MNCKNIQQQNNNENQSDNYICIDASLEKTMRDIQYRNHEYKSYVNQNKNQLLQKLTRYQDMKTQLFSVETVTELQTQMQSRKSKPVSLPKELMCYMPHNHFSKAFHLNTKTQEAMQDAFFQQKITLINKISGSPKKLEPKKTIRSVTNMSIQSKTPQFYNNKQYQLKKIKQTKQTLTQMQSPEPSKLKHVTRELKHSIEIFDKGPKLTKDQLEQRFRDF